MIWYLERNCTRVSTCQRPDDVSVGLCMTLEIYTIKILWFNIMSDTSHNCALILAFSKSTYSIWYVRMSLVIKYVDLTGDTCHFPMSILKNRKIATVRKFHEISTDSIFSAWLSFENYFITFEMSNVSQKVSIWHFENRGIVTILHSWFLFIVEFKGIWTTSNCLQTINMK